MTFPLFSRVILVEDILEENLFAGDIGTVVEYYPATNENPEGYEVEFFSANGETLAVVSLIAAALRAATRRDILHVRQLMAA
jgi:hypothetical protein